MSIRIDSRVDDALIVDDYPERLESRSRYSLEGILSSVQNFATVSEALRILGAVVLLASMSIFLLQGWDDGNDISRYLLLLSQTGLLAAGGFALSHGLKETKGARMFFGLALVSIPANFTILSALIYSVLQWDGALGTYPGYATWRIADAASTGLTLGGAMLVLIPVTVLCFAIMARRSATRLSLHFLILNSLLLLPIRSSTIVGAVALIGTVYALSVARRLTTRDGSLKTPEGKFALATLFIPIGIILFRSMYFYQIDSLLVAMLSITVFATLRQLSVSPDRTRRVALGIEVLSLPVALVAALSLTDAVAGVMAWEFRPLVFACIFATMALDIVRRTNSQVLANFASVSVSVLTSTSFILGVLGGTSLLGAFLCLAAGATLALAGHGFQDRVALVAGCLAAIAGIVFGFGEFIEMILRSSWIDLAIFGACAIALGSVLDRHGTSLKLRLEKWLAGLDTRRRERALP